MLFNSLQFLIFFPTVVLALFLIPHRFQWAWLLLVSYFFYMSSNPKYAILLLISTIITYTSGLLIEYANRNPDEKKKIFQKSLWVVISVVLNLLILFFFKYFGFGVRVFNSLLNILHMQTVEAKFSILLPAGISFYTFQALSYTIDVFRGQVKAERNFGKYALFVSFFPNILSGPIERAKNMLPQLYEHHTFDYDRVKNGLLLMVWGFFQKLVIADRLAVVVNTVYSNYPKYAGAQLLMTTVFYSLEIYCDFSGYSDIAIGAAQVMGIRVMNNFRQPYFAQSVVDFWRRWHISLSTWFRDYVYFPLGGSRCSKLKRYRNVMITFLVSGLWHGASWNYVVWGGLHGLFQVISLILKPVRDKVNHFFNIKENSFSHRLFRALFTFCLINFAWVFFRAPSLRDAVRYLYQIVTKFNISSMFNASFFKLGLDKMDFVLLMVMLLVLLTVSSLRNFMNLREAVARQNLMFRWFIYIAAVLSVLIFGMYGSGYTAVPFLYFQY